MTIGFNNYVNSKYCKGFLSCVVDAVCTLVCSAAAVALLLMFCSPLKTQEVRVNKLSEDT